MMNESEMPDILLCPCCEGENIVPSPGAEQALSFCLQCRFPLMLVAGKYRMLRVLGRGGFGTVYEAHHIHLTREEERVVKVLHPQLIADQSLRRRFMREIQVTCLLSQRNHHIVRIYDDFGEMAGLGFYYVMEHLKGTPLNELLQRHPEGVPLPQVYHLFSQLCVALQAAHHEGIIHRDLKPANLFVVQHLEDDCFLKVLDFGIAKAQQAHAETKRLTDGVIGTPAYMAPEQCMNEEVGPATDIYAMGIILFELLAGHLPFATAPSHTPSAAELITSHLTAIAPRLHDVLPAGRDVPLGLSDVLATALAKEPHERFPDARSFQASFEAAIGLGGAVPAAPVSHAQGTDADTRPMMAMGLPTGQLEIAPLAATQISLTPMAPMTGPIPSGDALDASPAGPASTDPELRAMPTPYASIPGVARLDRTTPSDMAGALRETAQQAPRPSQEGKGFGNIALLGLCVFLLAGVAAWWWKQAQTPAQGTAPIRSLSSLSRPDARSAKLPDHSAHVGVTKPNVPQVPVHRVLVPPRRATRRVPPRRTRRRARIRRRPRRVRRWARRPAAPRRLVPPKPTPRPAAPKGVAGCPVMPGYQVFVRFAKGRSLHLSFSGGNGRYIPHKGGYCVAVSHKRVKLKIKGSGFRAYTPCRLRLWGGPKQLRLTMFNSGQGGLEPEDEDYCKR